MSPKILPSSQNNFWASEPHQQGLDKHHCLSEHCFEVAAVKWAASAQLAPWSNNANTRYEMLLTRGHCSPAEENGPVTIECPVGKLGALGTWSQRVEPTCSKTSQMRDICEASVLKTGKSKKVLSPLPPPPIRAKPQATFHIHFWNP